MVKTGLQSHIDYEGIMQTAKYNFEAASGRKEGKLRFHHAFVDMERICNLACHGCFQFMDRDRTRKKLSYEEIKYIIDFAKEREADIIIIAGAGEPTLDPDFKKIVDYIKSKEMLSVVFTNGSTLDEELANFLFDHAVSPIIKKFAVDFEKQDYLIGRQGISKRMQRGLEILLKIKKQREKEGKQISEIGIDCYISRENIKDISGVLRYCRNNQLVPYIEAFIATGQAATASQLALPQQELNRLFEHLAEIDRDEYGILTPLKTGARTYGGEPCIKGKAGFAVHTDGTVLECVNGRYVFGNIRDRSLKEIFDLNDPEIRRYYSSIPCLGCQCSGVYTDGK